MSETILDTSTLLAIRQKALTDFYFFAKGVLGFDRLDPDIHKPICEILQNPKNNRVRIVLPRSWFKSTLVTVAFSIWLVAKDPNIRICIVQNSHTNARKKLAVIRGKFETCGLFRAIFPELMPNKDCTWSTDALCVPRTVHSAESTFETAGTRTKLTSRHYDVIIEDDTVAPDLDDLGESALIPSKEDVEQAIGWHRLALPLLVDSQLGRLIIVGTRWFEKDLISWNTEHEKQYVGYMRAVRETNGIADENGDITFPARFPPSVLKELENALGPYMYSCLYMNKPIRSTDMVFQPEWFSYYDLLPGDLIYYTTVDPAGDPEISKGEPDYNVVITTAVNIYNGRKYVIDYFRKKCNISELIQAIFLHVRLYSPIMVGIETVQYQQALVHVVKERMRLEALYFTVKTITHGKRSKNIRIQGLQPLVKSGDLVFKMHHRELISELVAFPYASNDDISDALSMQIPFWALTRTMENKNRNNPADDPLSFESAERELSIRRKETQRDMTTYGSFTDFESN